MKKQRLVMILTSDQDDQLEMIKEACANTTRSETIRMLIRDGYYKYVDNYKRALRPNSPKSAREKAEQKAEIAEERKALEQEKEDKKKFKICKELGGKVIEIDGRKYCSYVQYEELAGKEVQETVKEEPFSTIDESLLDYQYLTITGQKGEEAKKRIKELL